MKQSTSQGRRWLATFLLLVTPASLAFGDRVITTDGRVFSPKKAREVESGIQIDFETGGSITVTDVSQIQEIAMEGDMSDYVPKNDTERKNLEKGYVRYRDRWMHHSAYEAERKREFEKSQERLAELEAHGEFRNAWELETKHFMIYSNTSPEIMEEYEEILETYYAQMDKRVGINPTPSYRRKKMTVNIYKSYEDFQENAAADISPSTLGYFWSYDDTLNFFHDYSDPDFSAYVGLHECTHLLTFLIDQQFQPQIWLNEAVADFYGSAEMVRDKRGRLTIEPGKLQLDRVLTVQDALEDGSYTPLSKLFFLTRNEFDGFQYAHAWSFVYFLNNYDKGKYKKGFEKFFKGLYTLEKGIPSKNVPGAGPTGLGKSVSPEDIRDYLLKRIRVKDVDKLEEEWKEFIANIELDAPAALLKRGMRSTQQGEFDKALEDLDKALGSGLEHAGGYASRAQARAFKGDTSGAREDILKAIELDPLSAAYHYQASSMLAGVLSTTSRFGGGGIRFDLSDSLERLDPEKREEARLEAGMAMELDPKNDRYRDWYENFE